MKKKFAILVVYFLSALVAWPAPSAATTTVDTITRLSRSEASQQLPVSFDAVVTYFRSYDHMLFVQDGPSTMYVNATTDLKLVPGDHVRVRGTSMTASELCRVEGHCAPWTRCPAGADRGQL